MWLIFWRLFGSELKINIWQLAQHLPDSLITCSNLAMPMLFLASAHLTTLQVWQVFTKPLSKCWQVWPVPTLLCFGHLHLPDLLNKFFSLILVAVRLAKLVTLSKLAKPWKIQRMIEILIRWWGKPKESLQKSRKNLPSLPSIDFYITYDIKFIYLN